MKKGLSIALVILLVVLGGVVLYFKGRRYEVVISQEQIDTALAERFPATKSFLLIFDVAYTNPEVTLVDGSDRIRVGLDAVLNIQLDGEPKQLGGGCTVTSGLYFDPETHEFFLSDAQIDRLDIQGVPEEYLKPVEKFVSKYAREFIESSPVYRLKASDAKTAAAKMLLKEIEIRDQNVHVTLGL